MGVRSKLQDFKNRLSDRHMFSITITVLAVVASVGVYQYKRSIDFRNQLENQYQRSFNELVQYVNNIETSLAKGVIVTDPKAMVKLSNEIYSQAASASANLGQLPISEVNLENTSKFLAQVGDYTYNLSLKYLDGNKISTEEHNQLLSMSKYAQTLNQSLSDMQTQIYTGAMRFGQLTKKGNNLFGSQQNAMASQMEQVENQFQEYPSLIYDGPFSDHILTASPKLLENGKELTIEQATARVAEIVGQENSGTIQHTGESQGTIPSYTFTVTPPSSDKNRIINLEITKVNGMIYWMLDNRFVSESAIDIQTAKQKANDYLAKIGIKNMTESYYEVKSNIATINYAYNQNNIIIYSDLVKVKVAMDTGEILGVECKGYIMNHSDLRQLPTNLISEDLAKSKVSNAVTITSSRLAVIPLESKKEVLCYEFKANVEDKSFLIYINAQTGAEENILMLIINENGTLAI